MKTCTRCDCTGFLNLHQIPDEILWKFDETGDKVIIENWINENDNHDVGQCDCCDGSGYHGDDEKHFNCM